MTQVIWTPPALRDVARLHRFLAPKNRDAARRAVRTIRQGVRALTAHPEIGRPVDEMPPEFREWFVQFGNSGYVVLMTALSTACLGVVRSQPFRGPQCAKGRAQVAAAYAGVKWRTRHDSNV